LQWNITVYY